MSMSACPTFEKACDANHTEHEQEVDHFETWANENSLLLYHTVKKITMFLSSPDFCVNVIASHCHVDPKPAEINIYIHIMITPLNSSKYYVYVSLRQKYIIIYIIASNVLHYIWCYVIANQQKKKKSNKTKFYATCYIHLVRIQRTGDTEQYDKACHQEDHSFVIIAWRNFPSSWTF